jgi:predicted nucleotidyltransferase
MSANIHELMDELEKQLNRIYGQKLMGVYLFGSFARDEQVDGSDVDVLIVLNDFDSYAAEIERTGEVISDLSLEFDLSISRIFVDQAGWRNSDTPLLRNIRQEAIKA